MASVNFVKMYLSYCLTRTDNCLICWQSMLTGRSLVWLDLPDHLREQSAGSRFRQVRFVLENKYS